MFQNLCLVFCALYVAQNPFLQDACFKYSPQIMCFLVWTALLYKFAYARGHRAAHEEVYQHERALAEEEAREEYRKEQELEKIKARVEFKNSKEYMVDHDRPRF